MNKEFYIKKIYKIMTIMLSIILFSIFLYFQIFIELILDESILMLLASIVLFSYSLKHKIVLNEESIELHLLLKRVIQFEDIKKIKVFSVNAFWIVSKKRKSIQIKSELDGYEYVKDIIVKYALENDIQFKGNRKEIERFLNDSNRRIG